MTTTPDPTDLSTPNGSPGDLSPWRELVRGGHLPRFGLLCLGVWLHAADSLLVATLMPSAVLEIGGARWLGWTLALYEIGSVIAGAATGLLSRRRGVRPVMVTAALLFGLGCLISTLAPNMAAMLVGRLAQGLGGGGLVAVAFVATGQLFPARLLPAVMAFISAIWGASAFCGPLIGGLFANAGLWRGGFLAFAIQAALLALAAALTLGRRGAADKPSTAAINGRFPIRRLVVLSAAVIGIAGAGTATDIRLSLVLLVAGIAGLWLFFRLDARGQDRLLPRHALSLRSPVGAGILYVLFFATGTVAFTLYGPIMMQLRLGLSPLAAGYLVAFESICWTVAALSVTHLKPHQEPPVIRLGTLMMTAGVAGLVLAVPFGPVWSLLPCIAGLGAGFGMVWAFVMRRLVAAAEAGDDGDSDRAAGAMPTMQMIGYGIGAALAGLFANLAGFTGQTDLAVIETTGVWIFAGFLPILAIGWLTVGPLVRNRA